MRCVLNSPWPCNSSCCIPFQCSMSDDGHGTLESLPLLPSSGHKWKRQHKIIAVYICVFMFYLKQNKQKQPHRLIFCCYLTLKPVKGLQHRVHYSHQVLKAVCLLFLCHTRGRCFNTIDRKKVINRANVFFLVKSTVSV